MTIKFHNHFNFVMTVFVLLVVVSMSTTGCGAKTDVLDPNTAVVLAAGFPIPGNGNVLPLGLLDTMRFMMQVVNGSPGTFIMMSPTGDYLMAWAMQSNTWGFMGVTSGGVPVSDLSRFAGSNISNTMTFTQFVQKLEQAGWNYIMPGGLPPTLIAALSDVQAFISSFSSYIVQFPMIFVVPLLPTDFQYWDSGLNT